MSERPNDLVLRPDLRAGLIILVTMTVATVGIVTAILVGDAPIVGTVLVALIILQIGTMIHARIILTPDEILVRGVFYRQRRPRAHIAEVVRAAIMAPRGGAGESLFLLDAGRSLLIRVSVGGYKREDLDLLLDVLDVPCTTYDSSVEPRKFAETHPGLLSSAERHPYRFSFAVAAIICTALIALVLVALAISS